MLADVKNETCLAGFLGGADSQEAVYYSLLSLFTAALCLSAKRYSSRSHLERSTALHLSEQKGACGFSSVIGFAQVVHAFGFLVFGFCPELIL